LIAAPGQQRPELSRAPVDARCTAIDRVDNRPVPAGQRQTYLMDPDLPYRTRLSRNDPRLIVEA